MGALSFEHPLSPIFPENYIVDEFEDKLIGKYRLVANRWCYCYIYGQAIVKTEELSVHGAERNH